MKKAGLILALFSLMLPAMAQDKKLPYTLDDREMIIHLQGDVANLKDKAEALDKKVDAGFTRTDAGFADIKQQLNQQSNLFITSLFALFGASIGLIAVLIGYIFYDRRTTSAPQLEATKLLQKQVEDLEKRLIAKGSL
jgi:predicted PurR-regulated permease PerM